MKRFIQLTTFLVVVGQTMYPQGALYDISCYPFGATSCSQYVSVPPGGRGNVSCTCSAKCYSSGRSLNASAYAWVDGCPSPTSLSATGRAYAFAIRTEAEANGSISGYYYEHSDCDGTTFFGDPWFYPCIY